MKRIWFLLLAFTLLLVGCGKRQAAHPEWEDAWTRFGDALAAETPEDFAKGEYNDALSMAGIWYATWTSGDARSIINSAGEDAKAFDAEIYFLLKDCGSPEAAEFSVRDWAAHEAERYRTGDEARQEICGQAWQLRSLDASNPDNPYTHGAAAFAARGSLAVSAELLCAEGFSGDARAILVRFLNGIHYGE